MHAWWTQSAHAPVNLTNSGEHGCDQMNDVRAHSTSLNRDHRRCILPYRHTIISMLTVLLDRAALDEARDGPCSTGEKVRSRAQKAICHGLVTSRCPYMKKPASSAGSQEPMVSCWCSLLIEGTLEHNAGIARWSTGICSDMRTRLAHPQPHRHL